MESYLVIPGASRPPGMQAELWDRKWISEDRELGMAQGAPGRQGIGMGRNLTWVSPVTAGLRECKQSCGLENGTHREPSLCFYCHDEKCLFGLHFSIVVHH